MKRYAVKVTHNDGRVTYESIGKGQHADPQEAHLYTRLDLAEKKAAYYNTHMQWYRKADVITVTVSGLE